MTKETARDIAIAIIAKSGESFDLFAFDESDISEKDKEKICNEIQFQCSKMIDKIQSKYQIRLGGTTSEIIDAIVYE